MDARQKLGTLEWLGDIIVGAKAETRDFGVSLAVASQDYDWSGDARNTQAAQHLVSMQVRQRQIE